MKYSTFRWFGHLERMGENNMTRIYKCGTDAERKRRHSTVLWEGSTGENRGCESERNRICMNEVNGQMKTERVLCYGIRSDYTRLNSTDY